VSGYDAPLRAVMHNAAQRIVEAGGMDDHNQYKHRVDVRIPMMVFDPKLGREQIVTVRARFTVEKS